MRILLSLQVCYLDEFFILLFSVTLEWDNQGKDRANSFSRINSDVSSESISYVSTDSKAKTTPLLVKISVLHNLREVFEKLTDRFLVHPSPRVFYLKMNLTQFFMKTNTQSNVPTLSVFNCIRQQVDQNLLQSISIRNYYLW